MVYKKRLTLYILSEIQVDLLEMIAGNGTRAVLFEVPDRGAGHDGPGALPPAGDAVPRELHRAVHQASWRKNG